MKIELTRQLSSSYGPGVEPGTTHDGVTLKGNRAQFQKPGGIKVTAPHGYYKVLKGEGVAAEPQAVEPEGQSLDEAIEAAQFKADLENLGRAHGIELDQSDTRTEMEKELRSFVVAKHSLN